MFTQTWANVLSAVLILSGLLTWGAMRLLNQIDQEGVVKKAAKAKFINTLTRWLS
jgi:hypothetical protein